jgi:FixJ family two-component response regulator
VSKPTADPLRTLEEARRAVEDAARCDRQLKELGTARDQRIADAMRRRLERRKSQDEAATARAADLIYSCDRLTDRQRDVLLHRYVLGKSWRQVARAVDRSVRPCQIDRNEALAALDAASDLKAV